MKRKKGSSTVLAAVLICIGTLLVFTSLVLSGFNLSSVSSLQFADVAHGITLPFDSIRVEEIDCTVLLRPSEDGTCTVVSQETSHLFNIVAVEDGTLTVRRRDERAWHERILVFGAAEPTLTLYLPVRQYEDLTLRTTAGNVSVEAPFAFRSANLKSVSGDILLTASVSEEASLSTTSGSITVRNLNVTTLTASATSGALSLRGITADAVTLSTVSGEIRMNEGIRAGTLSAKSTNGSVLLTDINVTETLSVTGVSGNVALFNAEFADAYVETASGNVTGTLRSSKSFDVQTTSGVILHPESSGGARLRVRTVSGNISFSYLSEKAS